MNNTFTTQFLGALALLILPAACASEDAGGGGAAGNGMGQIEVGAGPCDAAADCAGDVCVALIDGNNPPVYCSQECTAGGCPDGFTCDESTFALVGLSFCRYGDPAEPPTAVEEPPILPCTDDVDCDDGFVCAELNGERGCAKSCEVEADCTPPAIGGVVIDVATCGQSDGGRAVCVGDPACYPDATQCIEGGLPGGDLPGG